MRIERICICAVFAAALGTAAAPVDWTRARDLNPVRRKPTPAGRPVVLVAPGAPPARIVVEDPAFKTAADEIRLHVELATGAKMEIADRPGDGPFILLAGPATAAARGIRVEEMPAEGFEIKTADGGVVIAGRNVLWGAYEFLERFVGVRWYYPGELGRSVPRSDTLVVKPVWIADAPVFRKRENWPANYAGGAEIHRRLRAGGSWPNPIVCHTPHAWPKYYAGQPELFQLRPDGTRDMGMLCYGNPATMEKYLLTIEETYAGKYRDEKGKPVAGPWGWAPPNERTIPVSPNDAPVTCACPLCRRDWHEEAGRLGEASAVVAKFVARLAAETEKRWPDKTVTYLAYSNYTMPPAGVSFPGNVEVHVCGMRALANYKEPEIARSEQEIIDGWRRISGRPLQNWHYLCWPDDSTSAPYLFPHVIRDFYRKNRTATVGTFINGGGNHWPRHHVSLYAWMKVLWNPDFDADAAVDEFCRRMYGPAATTVRELVRMQTDGWEKSRWAVLPAGHNVSPRSIHEESYPRAAVEKMEALLAKARREAAGDETVLRRIEYYAGPLEVFFKESRQYHGGSGRTPVQAMKAGEDPVVDGKLDDAVWRTASPAAFRRALDKDRPEPAYPTEIRAVWTARGITFGFRMAEPEPGKMAVGRKVHDDAGLWWDDNVEVFVDPAAQRASFYQWILTASGTTYDGSFTRGAAWEPAGVKAASHVGGDFWSCELFIPYEVFRADGVAVDPAKLSGKTWYGNFTRHRTAKPSEMQRLNTTFEGTNHNMIAFGPVTFLE